MKILIAFIACIALTSCSTTNAPTGTQISQGIVTAGQLANIGFAAYQQYQDAKAGKSTPQQVITQVTNDFSGIAALAQAYVGTGKTPTQANITAGAASTTPASVVVAALPNQPITQAMVNTIFQAAAQTSQP